MRAISKHVFFLLSSPLLPVVSRAAVTARRDCKVTPDSPAWPSKDDWAALNTSVGGHLLAPTPPAIVCDPLRPTVYNATSCAALDTVWFQDTFYNEDPISLYSPNFQDDACLPSGLVNGSVVCDLGPFPHYTVNATEAGHVAQAMKFAARTGVRLAVKGTGHDYLGR
jgi:hypothetical protein